MKYVWKREHEYYRMGEGVVDKKKKNLPYIQFIFFFFIIIHKKSADQSINCIVVQYQLASFFIPRSEISPMGGEGAHMHTYYNTVAQII